MKSERNGTRSRLGASSTRSLASRALIGGLLSCMLASGASAHGGDAGAFKAQQGSATGKIVVTPEIQKALGIVVQPVGERQLPSDLVVSGQVEALPSKTIEINAPVAGRILRLDVQRGSTIFAGQEIAVLDSPEVRSLAVDAARTQAQGQGQVEQARARLRLAQTTVRRQKTLLDAGISARKDYDVAQAELGTAQAELSAATSQVQLSGSALSTRLSSLGQSGVRATAAGTIVLSSPLRGTVIDQTAASGEAVEAGKTLLKVVDTSSVSIAGQVYEKDLAKIRIGQPVAATVQSYPNRTFLGAVSSIDPAVDSQTRTVSVRATLFNPAGVLKPQMFATVQLITGAGGKAVVAIPRSAVLDADGRQTVFVKNGDAFQSTAVTLGRTSGSYVEVTDGLYAGDSIVTQGAFQLHAQLLKGPAAAADAAHDPVAKASAPSGPPLWASLVGLFLIAVAAFFAGRVSRGRRQTAFPINDAGHASNGSASLFAERAETRHPR